MLLAATLLLQSLNSDRRAAGAILPSVTTTAIVNTQASHPPPRPTRRASLTPSRRSMGWAHTHSLTHSHTRTHIHTQASTPLLVSVADYFFLERELPSVRSWVCLVVLLVGAAGYALTDKNFSVDAYSWVVVWYAVFCFDQARVCACVSVSVSVPGGCLFSPPWPPRSSLLSSPLYTLSLSLSVFYLPLCVPPAPPALSLSLSPPSLHPSRAYSRT
jgi:hypothetical protein